MPFVRLIVIAALACVPLLSVVEAEAAKPVWIEILQRALRGATRTLEARQAPAGLHLVETQTARRISVIEELAAKNSAPLTEKPLAGSAVRFLGGITLGTTLVAIGDDARSNNIRLYRKVEAPGRIRELGGRGDACIAFSNSDGRCWPCTTDTAANLCRIIIGEEPLSFRCFGLPCSAEALEAAEARKIDLVRGIKLDRSAAVDTRSDSERRAELRKLAGLIIEVSPDHPR